MDDQQQQLPLAGGDQQPPAPEPGAEAAHQARLTTMCEKCRKAMLKVLNIVTKKVGPVDVRAPVYVIRGDLTVPNQQTQAMTSTEFLKALDFVQLKDGTRIPARQLAFYVSHFATCPYASHFSQSNRGGGQR